MNKQDALSRLEAIESEAKALRAIIEAPDTPKLWRPEGDEVYFSIGGSGEISGLFRNRDLVKFGNCYKTRECAKTASKFISTAHKVCAAALQVDPDAGEWSKERPWSASKNDPHADKPSWNAYKWEHGTERICVHTREQAKQVAAILNAEGV